MSFQWQMILLSRLSHMTGEDKVTCTNRPFKTKHPWLKNSCLPPEMKSVQWAARTARASGSRAQASGSEAAS